MVILYGKNCMQINRRICMPYICTQFTDKIRNDMQSYVKIGEKS